MKMMIARIPSLPFGNLCKRLLCLLALLLCFAALFFACSKDTDESSSTLTASELLYGALQRCDSGETDLFCYRGGDGTYEELFEAYYHGELSRISEGALAYASGVSASEISILRPADGSDKAELQAMLEAHLQEQIACYESYSPADTAKLKKALLYTEEDFVILLVLEDAQTMQDAIRECLRHPENLPPLPEIPASEEEDDTSDELASSGNSEDTVSSGDLDLPSEQTSAATDLTYPYAYDCDRAAGILMSETELETAVCIGDSRLYDLLHYTGVKVAGNFAFESLSVNGVFTRKLVETENGLLTIAEALRQTDFDRCYLMFGVNELGWVYPSVFIRDYVKVIDLVRSCNPDAAIYLLNIYPVTAEHSASHGEENNPRIRIYNDLIAEMAVEQKVHHINAAAALCDEEEVLPAQAASDGVHAGVEQCRILLDYILRRG